MLFVSAQLVVAMSVAFTLQQNFGSVNLIQLPWLLIAAVFTAVFFVAEDLSRFLLHRAMHRIPFLWRYHKTHHSAQILTPLTVHRVHPIEICLYYTRGVLVFGIVSGVFIYVFGSKLSALDILGVDALGFLFNMVAANLRHSHIWLSFGRFERVFISPAQHQIHHSIAPEHHDTNFGTCLAVWDRLFGSWIAAGMIPKRLRFGVAAHSA
jgi:sterol desaturase/sphingolipid hydroxylase (fatty acid hydroxylase superfamily)|tara:strand:- start:3353 stop:3979 length:627 start_codon:yes stop_codon:yes gene_type:complete